MDYQGNPRPIDFSHIDPSLFSGVPYDELIRIGIERLRKTVVELCDIRRDHVVPLSGGLDSRLILGALLEHVEARSVCTYTYGIPGSYDFEIAQRVAGAVGTQHTLLPTNRWEYRIEDLLDVARRTECQAMVFHTPPLRELDHRFSGADIWSGFVGDAVAGSFLYQTPSPTLREAQLSHLRRRTFVRSERLWTWQDEQFLPHMVDAFADSGILTLDEQMLFGEAVPKFTAPLVLFGGFRWLTPLINNPWMDFMFSVPNRYRVGQKLMIEIGRLAFPDLFNLPSKNRLGHTFDTSPFLVKSTLWLNRARKLLHQFVPSVNWPNFQYNDFHEGIRSDPSLRQVIKASIEDLRRRGICDWVDFDGIWRRHDRRIRNHGDALVVLASLELVLKAREMDR